MKKEKLNSMLKIIIYIIFFIYLLLLIKILLFKYVDIINLFKKIFSNSLDGFRSINLIPFKSIFEFVKVMFTKNFLRGFNNIIGNVLIFAPLGYFLPLLFKNFKKLKNTILFSFGISLLFEICQYVLYLGSADIDDIILNVCGSIVGFLFYKIISKITQNKKTIKYTTTIILSIIGFIVGGYLAIDYFGIMFGIEQNTNNSTINNNYDIDLNDNKIKVNEDNIYVLYGYIEELNDNEIVINKIITKDLENGTGIAVSDKNNKILITINLLKDTEYKIKDIYDINGSKVNTRNGSFNDLKLEQNIEIKGYELNDILYANEITINNFLF